ncbi:DUF2087 domain-containing protein [Pelagibacterium xiamenense]|uniref:DUF2087 domain-containing protein n=1 Tax=Pelagibacterium xiamenense TaxID=2901140 RepID=UPI001E45C2D2|nr:DUF2087 domain-containing protein [Pelagibacterium xiamenense]MCD7061114.1 DUF2087 domain-containing protein [Pelagibacterium xiamenense]
MAEPAEDKISARRLDRVARCFSPSGRLQRWPARRTDQELALWVIWSQLPGAGQHDELEINAMLRTWHDYEDFVLLRRELCDLDLLRRTPDGRIYRRVAHTMPPEAVAVVERLDNASL